MSRPRGNRNSQAHIEARHKKEIDLMNKGKTIGEVAQEIGVSRMTLWRDLGALTERFRGENSQAYEEMKKTQLTVFELMERSLVEGKIDSRTATAWKGIRQEISALLGLNAPTKSVSMRVEAGPEKMRLFDRFMHETARLPEAEHEKVWEFVRELVAAQPVVVHAPPQDSPLWHEEKKQIGEGE